MYKLKFNNVQLSDYVICLHVFVFVLLIIWKEAYEKKKKKRLPTLVYCECMMLIYNL